MRNAVENMVKLWKTDGYCKKRRREHGVLPSALEVHISHRIAMQVDAFRSGSNWKVLFRAEGAWLR